MDQLEKIRLLINDLGGKVVAVDKNAVIFEMSDAKAARMLAEKLQKGIEPLLDVVADAKEIMVTRV
jgi:hypothetical protein